MTERLLPTKRLVAIKNAVTALRTLQDILVQNLHKGHLSCACNQFVSSKIWLSLICKNYRQQNLRHDNESTFLVPSSNIALLLVDHRKLKAGTAQVFYPNHEHALNYKLDAQTSYVRAPIAIWKGDCMTLPEMGTQSPHQPQTTIFAGDMRLSRIYMEE